MPPRSPRKSPNTARNLHAARVHAALRGDGMCDSSSDLRAICAPRRVNALPHLHLALVVVSAVLLQGVSLCTLVSAQVIHGDSGVASLPLFVGYARVMHAMCDRTIHNLSDLHHVCAV